MQLKMYGFKDGGRVDRRHISTVVYSIELTGGHAINDRHYSYDVIPMAIIFNVMGSPWKGEEIAIVESSWRS